MSSPTTGQVAGVVGFFDGPNEILEAMRKVRGANYWSIDCFTPFPVHGMDEAQGLKRSIIPILAFGAGLTGFCIAFGGQYWTSAIDWPINVGGKPLNSWPAFVPVIFEVTVLLAGITTLLGLIALCRLPNVTKKIVDSSITRDRFAIIVEAPQTEDDKCSESDKGHKVFEPTEVETFLRSVGASDVRKVYTEGWF